MGIAALSLLFSCDKEEEAPKVSRTQLLAGTTHVTWYRHSITPPPADDVCSSSEDDSYIFFADGTLEYDHRTVVLDQENGCGDFVNYVGTWELTDNDTQIKLVAEHPKDDPSSSLDLTILEGELRAIDTEKFVIIATDPSTGTEHSIEYRKR